MVEHSQQSDGYAEKRRALAAKLLDKVQQDPSFREKLLKSSKEALEGTELGQEIKDLEKSKPHTDDCSFTCVLITT